MTPRPPDFLCIGAAKAGTTWLYRVLRSCPGYWMPPVKELRYLLLRELRGSDQRNARGRIEDILRDIQNRAATAKSNAIDADDRAWLQHYVFGEPKDDDWYFGLFSSAGRRVTGDVSPGYAHIENAKAVSVLLPHASAVLIVRNPIERDLSHALHHAVLRSLGVSKTWKLALHLADRLALPGKPVQQVEALRNRFAIPQASELDVSDLLTAYNRESGGSLQPDDLVALLDVKVSLDDVRALLGAPGMMREARQSETVRKWRDAFAERFHVFLFDDLTSDPRDFVHDVTNALGRPSMPADEPLLTAKINPGMYAIAGLDELRNEVRLRCAAEIDALQELLGDRVVAWRQPN